MDAPLRHDLPSRRRRPMLAAGALGVAALLAACGSNDNEKLAGIVPLDDQRFARHPKRHEVAGIFEFFLARHHEPVLHEHVLFFARVDLRR